MDRLTEIGPDGQWRIKGFTEIFPAHWQACNRLAAYEDTGLEPEEINELCTDDVAEVAEMFRKMIESGEINHLQDLLQAEKDGKLVKLPFVAMVEQSLQDGEMKPQRDQRFNGRYAVVYIDRKKWKSPLIDICGTHYNKQQAEQRLKELSREEAEAALAGKGGDC